MMEQLAALVVDESKWLTMSMGLALLSVIAVLYRHRHSGLPPRHRLSGAMNLLFGMTIGTMAFGHLLAVTTKLALRTLEGPVALLYFIGIALAVPSWWLTYRTLADLASSESHGRATLALNAWLVLTLVAFGVHNLPLAAQGFLNIAYQLHSRRAAGWAIVGIAAMVNAGLFVGSLIFLASGQSFEQFSGME
jgi:hypothetical protein